MPRIDNARYKYVLEVLMNESKIGFFRSFIYSITSFDKYRLFLRQSTGRVVAYLILLSLVLALITCASWYPMTSKVVNIFRRTTGRRTGFQARKRKAGDLCRNAHRHRQ